MWVNKPWVLMPLLGLSASVTLTVMSLVSAQPLLANEYSQRVSHSVGSQHNNHRQHYNHYRHRDPWRWGIGWDQGWGGNQYWGPSIGVSWSNANNLRYNSVWKNNDYPSRQSGFYPYQNQLNAVYQPQAIEVLEPVAVAPRQQTTTSIQYAQGLNHLPENAKVIQRENGTVYEWQGVEYYFDWNTQTYEVAKADTR